jgi:hypothetical protein
VSKTTKRNAVAPRSYGMKWRNVFVTVQSHRDDTTRICIATSRKKGRESRGCTLTFTDDGRVLVGPDLTGPSGSVVEGSPVDLHDSFFLRSARAGLAEIERDVSEARRE